MASSLARQLEQQRTRNATPSTRVGGGGKHRSSILFDSREAGDYDAKTIYELGLSGLQELVDGGASDLEAFREALFGKAVAETERHLQDGQVNEQLDKALNSFLDALAPWLLQRPAQKVLEYLVRHFQVHVHNVDRLLVNCLPIHDTPLFAKVVALPCKVEQTRWAFLQPIAKTREPLSRPQLVKACLSEMGIVAAVAAAVERRPASARLVPFFAVLACEIVYRASQGKQKGKGGKLHVLDATIVPALVPPALAALRDGAHAERQRAGYLMVGQLAKHAQLSDKAGKLFMLSCARKCSLETLPDALQCCAVVLFFGPRDAGLPAKCVKRLANKFDAAAVVAALRKAFAATTPAAAPAARFLKALASQLLTAEPLADAGLSNTMALLSLVARECPIPDAAGLFEQAAAAYETASKANKGALVEVAEALATRFPDSLDAALGGAGSPATFAFASACFANNARLVSSRPLESDGVRTTLRLAVHHERAGVRRHALEELAAAGASLEDLDLPVLVDRIGDEDAAVCAAALRLLCGVLGNAAAASPSAVTSPLADEKQQAALADALHAAADARAADADAVRGILAAAAALGTAPDLLLLAVRFLASSDHAEDALEALRCADAARFGTPSNKRKKKKTKAAANCLAEAALQLAEGGHEELVLALAARATSRGSGAACVAVAQLAAACLEQPAGDEALRPTLLLLAASLATSSCVWTGAPPAHVETLLEALVGQLEAAEAQTATRAGDLLTAGRAPLSFRFLCTLLSAPEAAFASACAQPLQLLLGGASLNGALLRSLLLVAADAVEGACLPAQRRALMCCASLVRASEGSGRCFLEAAPYALAGLASASAAVRSHAVELVEALLLAPAGGKAYLELGGATKAKGKKKKADGAEEALPAPVGAKLAPAETMRPLLERVLAARREFAVEEDSKALERLGRTLASEAEAAAVDAVVTRASFLLAPAAPPQEAEPEATVDEPKTLDGTPWPCRLRLDAARCARGMCSTLLRAVPAHGIGRGTCALAKAALEAGEDALLGMAIDRWGEAGATVDPGVVLAGLQRRGNARDVVLRVLRAPRVYSALSAKQQEAALDALCELVRSEKAGSALAAGAVRAIGQVPFSGAMLAKRLAGADTPVVVLEAVRARLFYQDQDQHASDKAMAATRLELCGALLEPLFAVLKAGRRDLLVLVCLNQALAIVGECRQKGLLSVSSGKRVAAAMSGVDLALVVESVLAATGAPERNACLELVTTCTRLFPAKALDVVLPILQAVGGVDGETGGAGGVAGAEASPYTLMLLECMTRCLAAMSRESGGAEEVKLLDVLALFVDACALSGNTQRVLQLYRMLVQSCTPDGSSLGAVAVLVLLKSAEEDLEQRCLDLQALFQGFPVAQQVAAMAQVLRCMHGFLPNDAMEMEDEDEEDAKGDELESALVEMAVARSSEDARFAAARSLAACFSGVLGSRPFIRQLRALSAQAVEAQGLQGPRGFLGLLNHLHRQVHRCGGRPRWSGLREELVLLLDKISALLSVPMFVAVLQELLHDEDPHVRHLAVRQLSRKVEQQHEGWRAEEVLIFLEMAAQLHEMIAAKDEAGINKQTALLSVDVLVRHLGPKHPKPFVPLLQSVVAELQAATERAEKEPPAERLAALQLASSACLCAGTLVQVLGKQTLGLLPRFAPLLLAAFTQYRGFADAHGDDDEGDEEERDTRQTLAQSAASSLYALVSELPQFVSPYLGGLLELVGTGDKEGVPELIRATSSRVGARLAARVEPRLLLQPIAAALRAFAAAGDLEAAGRVAAVLHATVETMPREAVTLQLPALTEIFAGALGLRQLAIGDLLEPEAVAAREAAFAPVEADLVACFMDLVLKLNSAQLRKTFAALRGTVSDGSGAFSDTAAAAAAAASGAKAESRDVFGGIQDPGSDEEEEEAKEANASSSGSRKRKAAGSKDDSSDEEDEDDDSASASSSKPNASVDPEQDWARQCRAQTLYLIVREMGERLMSLAVPYVTLLMDECMRDLELESAGNDEAETSRARKKRKGAAAAAASSLRESDMAARRWQLQQRSVRARALGVVGLFCDLGRDLLVEEAAGEAAKSTRHFGAVLDGILSCMDIDKHRLVGLGGELEGEEDNVEFYSAFVDEHVLPALVKLAKAACEESMWQTLHHAVLEFAKHASPAVRCATIRVVVALFERVGDQYIVLVADTIPAVAELLEDTDKQVKQNAHAAAKKLQQLSGEDLTSFLR